VLQRSLAFLAAFACVGAVAPTALAVRVHVRVEGKTQTIYGSTEPLLNVTATALDALEAASAAGEFFYHMQSSSFGDYVDQIGRYTAAGEAGWDFKVNGESPPVGADKVTLKAGDRVLWFWAQFGIVPGGPQTLLLSRARANCYRVVKQDDNGKVTAAVGAVLHVGSRVVKTQGATGAAVGCVGKHSTLVRATLGGAVRSNALR
jgi:Domain of unknown function (DUF4430)